MCQLECPAGTPCRIFISLLLSALSLPHGLPAANDVSAVRAGRSSDSDEEGSPQGAKGGGTLKTCTVCLEDYRFVPLYGRPQLNAIAFRQTWPICTGALEWFWPFGYEIIRQPSFECLLKMIGGDDNGSGFDDVTARSFPSHNGCISTTLISNIGTLRPPAGIQHAP